MRKLYLISLLFLVPNFASAAIALDNSSNDVFSANAAASLSVPITVSSNANRANVICVYDDGASSITSVTDGGGTNMTFIAQQIVDTANSAYVNAYNFIAPATGTDTIVVHSSGNAGRIRAVASQLSGVSQTGQPDASHVNHTASASSLANTVSTVANNSFAYLCYGLKANGGTSPGTGSTQIGTDGGSPENQYQSSSNPITPAGLVSMTVNNGVASESGGVAISFSPVATAATSVSILGLLKAFWIF